MFLRKHKSPLLRPYKFKHQEVGKTRMVFFAILSSCDCKHNIAHGFHNRIPLGSRFHGKKILPQFFKTCKCNDGMPLFTNRAHLNEPWNWQSAKTLCMTSFDESFHKISWHPLSIWSSLEFNFIPPCVNSFHTLASAIGCKWNAMHIPFAMSWFN